MSKFNTLFNQICKDYIEISEDKENFTNINFDDLSCLNTAEVIPILNDDIIKETDNNIENDMYKTTYFIEFFDLIKNIKLKEHLSDNKLRQIFLPIFNRNINKEQKHKDVYILKFSFYNKKSYLKAWNLLNQYHIVNEETTEIINNFYDKHILGKFSIGGFYVKLKDKNWSLILLNEQNFNESTIKHELIHYFQDVLGISIFNFIKPQDILEDYGLCKNIDLSLLFREEEVVPYANEICYIFEKYGVNNLADAQNIIIKFMNILNEDNKIYINKCKKLDEYSWFIKENKQDIIEFFILCYLYSMEVFNYMKLIIENYFK